MIVWWYDDMRICSDNNFLKIIISNNVEWYIWFIKYGYEYDDILIY